MLFRRPKTYTITLQRAHTLLKIPRDSITSTTEELQSGPSREQILEAFRGAAKRHHPDLASGIAFGNASSRQVNQSTTAAKLDTSVTFRECHEARELLLDYYVHRKYIHPEILQSTKNKPRKDHSDESLFSVWKKNKSFQFEVLMRLSVCIGLAVGTYFHDRHMPERRKQQVRRRDEQFFQFGPQPPF
eukprot:scaffold248343_cov115-Cyclotella_meneghiniana.AAC.2